MLEGLEVCEVNFSYARSNNDIFRIDSNYFQKQFLKEEIAINARGGQTLQKLGVQLRSFGAYSLNNNVDYLDTGVPFIRGVNMKKGRVNFDDLTYISEEAHALLWKSEITPETVLLSMSGTVGDVALASKSWKYPVNSNQDIAKIDTKGQLNPYALYAFLLSRFGQNYLKREARGSVQQHVFLSQIEQFKMPTMSTDLEVAIQKVIESSDATQAKAISSLRLSERALTSALGLENWQIPESLSYVRNSLDSFATGRLDAEYFQPKYAKLIELIEATGQASPLADLLQTNQRGKQPEYAESGLPVVNSKHVANGEVRVDADNRYAKSSDSGLLIEAGDVLINGTGVGTIGRAAPYLQPFKAIPDNHVTILRPYKGSIDPVYLAVFLNSLAGQLQVEQRFRGSSGQIELYPNDIAQFTIWVAPENIQTQVRQYVEASFQAKQRAAQLLDAAKRAVEIAIEDSEAAALTYLEGVNP